MSVHFLLQLRYHWWLDVQWEGQKSDWCGLRVVVKRYKKRDSKYIQLLWKLWAKNPGRLVKMVSFFHFQPQLQRCHTPGLSTAGTRKDREPETYCWAFPEGTVIETPQSGDKKECACAGRWVVPYNIIKLILQGMLLNRYNNLLTDLHPPMLSSTLFSLQQPGIFSNVNVIIFKFLCSHLNPWSGFPLLWR